MEVIVKSKNKRCLIKEIPDGGCIVGFIKLIESEKDLKPSVETHIEKGKIKYTKIYLSYEAVKNLNLVTSRILNSVTREDEFYKRV
jgi:hypothetical protein